MNSIQKIKNFLFASIWFLGVQQHMLAQRFNIADSNNLYGIKNLRNIFVVQPQYDSIKYIINDVVDRTDSYFITYKKKNKGLIVTDGIKDKRRRISKYFTVISLKAEFDSIKAFNRIVFAFKNNKMTVFSFFGKKLLSFKDTCNCCFIPGTGPSWELFKNKDTKGWRDEKEEKIKEVEKLHKQDKRYATYDDDLLVCGSQCYRIIYYIWPRKIKSVKPVKLSKIMKEEVDWFLENYCPEQFSYNNTY